MNALGEADMAISVALRKQNPEGKELAVFASKFDPAQDQLAHLLLDKNTKPVDITQGIQ